MTPYLLTASHNIPSQNRGQNLNEVGNRDFWLINYQSQTCANPSQAPSYYAVTGGEVVAIDREPKDFEDFALIELPERIPPAYRTFYVGWSIKGNEPQEGTVVGHPNGTIKKSLSVATSDRPVLKSGESISTARTRMTEA